MFYKKVGLAFEINVEYITEVYHISKQALSTEVINEYIQSIILLFSFTGCESIPNLFRLSQKDQSSIIFSERQNILPFGENMDLIKMILTYMNTGGPSDKPYITKYFCGVLYLGESLIFYGSQKLLQTLFVQNFQVTLVNLRADNFGA